MLIVNGLNKKVGKYKEIFGKINELIDFHVESLQVN